MRYYDARQNSETKKWHYTVRQDKFIDAVGYCADDAGHATAKEACACYRGYLVENATLGMKMSAKLQCEYPGCEEFTKGLAMYGGRPVVLCEKHQDKASLEAVVPEVGSSIES